MDRLFPSVTVLILPVCVLVPVCGGNEFVSVYQCVCPVKPVHESLGVFVLFYLVSIFMGTACDRQIAESMLVYIILRKVQLILRLIKIQLF